MKRYEKPMVSVIELQLKENIAAVPTTVYKGETKNSAKEAYLVDMALSAQNTGLTANGDLVVS